MEISAYELDLGAFTEEEKKEVKQQVQEYKRIRELIFQGELYRLASRLREISQHG